MAISAIAGMINTFTVVVHHGCHVDVDHDYCYYHRQVTNE